MCPELGSPITQEDVVRHLSSRGTEIEARQPPGAIRRAVARRRNLETLSSAGGVMYFNESYIFSARLNPLLIRPKCGYGYYFFCASVVLFSARSHRARFHARMIT